MDLLTWHSERSCRLSLKTNKNDQKDGSFFTSKVQNLQLSTNSTVSVSTVNFQDSNTQRFQTKFTTEQLERFPGASPIKTYSSFTMTLLWVTDQQWEDCYQFAKIRKKSSYKIIVTKVNKPNNFSFLFCLIPGEK